MVEKFSTTSAGKFSGSRSNYSSKGQKLKKVLAQNGFSPGFNHS